MKPRKSPQPAPPAKAPFFSRAWPYLALLTLACGAYANSLGNGFVSDDHFQLLGNPLVSDWRRFPEIFQHHVWAFAGGATSNYYRPFQTLVYLVLHTLFGFNPVAFHLVQVFIHGANTLLVYALGARLLKSSGAAFVAAVLFAVHPIHSEAVDWIAVMPDVLLTMAALIALLLFARWQAVPRGRQIAALTALYLAAMLIKEPGAILLPLLAGYEFLYLGRPPREILRRNGALYASLAAAFGVYLLLRVHALGSFAPAQGVNHDLGGAVFVLSLLRTLGEYFALLVAPVHLNYFRYFEPASSVTPAVLVSLAIALAAVAAIFLLRSRREGRAPAVSFGLFLLLFTLLPALNLNGIGQNVVAERYLYLPSVGFVLVLAAAWDWLARRQRGLASALAAIAAAASLWILLPRNPQWRDDEQLLTASIALSPRALLPISDLGTYYYTQGKYDAAIERYRQALELAPDNEEMLRNLGNAYERKGSYPEAVTELRRAVALKPNDPEAHMSLGLSLGEAGDLDTAAAEDQRTLALRPEYPEALSNLAMVRIEQRDFAGAAGLLRRALALNPGSFEAQYNLGIAYNNTRQFQEAVDTLQQAIRMAPDHPRVFLAHFQLGIAYAELNLTADSARELETTLELQPDFAPASDALAMARRQLGQSPKNLSPSPAGPPKFPQ